MPRRSPDDGDDEFFDCLSDVKYCAIASPRGCGSGEVFLDFKEAQTRWRRVRGSRMKVFDNFTLAQNFANTPVESSTADTLYPPSPKADVEATPFASVSQAVLVQFRGFIEKGDVDKIRSAVDENPMILVTSSDTPTLLQIRLRYNALHVAAAIGGCETLELLLRFLNSLEFWKRIYPSTDDTTTRDRQWHVIDLYLNSPELGNLETPLHFASKFGHVTCTRTLASHPLTQLDALNRNDQTPSDVAASRANGKTSQCTIDDNNTAEFDSRYTVLCTAIRRIFDERYILLADVFLPTLSTERVFILPPLTLHQLQSILARFVTKVPSGLSSIVPFLEAEMLRMDNSSSDHHRFLSQEIDISHYGIDGVLRAIRAIAGPMVQSEVSRLSPSIESRRN